MNENHDDGPSDLPTDYIGSLRSPDDEEDYIFERLARGHDGFLSEFPEMYDLRSYSQPSRDQGRRGTCGAFTAAAIKEIQESRDCGFNEWMSPEFIYYHRDNKPAQGMYGRNVFQILKRVGSVPESIYPYNYDQMPDNEHYEIAAQYKISNFARVTTIDGLKRALIEIGPCYLQLPLYKSRPIFWKIDSDIETRPIGGHALAVVGYNKDGFILKNSWGLNWNGDGCIVFPYADWGLHWECWVSIDEKTPMPPKRYSGTYTVADRGHTKIIHEHHHTHTYKKTTMSDPSMSLTASSQVISDRRKPNETKSGSKSETKSGSKSETKMYSSDNDARIVPRSSEDKIVKKHPQSEPVKRRKDYKKDNCLMM